MPYKYDPELEPVMSAMAAMKALAPPVALHDVATRRQNGATLAGVLQSLPRTDGVEKKEFTTTTADGYEMKLVWYFVTGAPAGTAGPGPALLHMHGGGMISFDVTAFDTVVNNTVAASGVPMLSVDYRLAPEKKHPSLLEDCYAGLTWLRDHAAELGVDPKRIGVMGESAGGGLSAGLALLARDRKFEPPLAKQVLVYPMLDDRNIVPIEELVPFTTWTYEDNITGWTAYVGEGVAGTDKVSKYSAPAREIDLAGLPSTYIDVGTLDIFLDEDVKYAEMLAKAGVEVEHYEYEGAPHGFDLFPSGAGVIKRAFENRVRAIKSF